MSGVDFTKFAVISGSLRQMHRMLAEDSQWSFPQTGKAGSLRKLNTNFLGEGQAQGGKWKSLPKGWDAESRSRFWASLTGEKKHKVTACIDKMKGTEIDDPGAFCASLADREEPGWRSEGKRNLDPSALLAELQSLLPGPDK